MKKAILKRDVKGKNYNLKKGTEVFIAQSNIQGTLVRIKEADTIEYPVAFDALRFVAPPKVKVKIHVKRQPRRNDSMFYFGKHIATVTVGRRVIAVESAGEMRACFTEDGDNFLNEQLAKELKSRGTTDRGLSSIGKNDFITLNNWFRLTDLETERELGIAHTYDDAIALATEVAKSF